MRKLILGFVIAFFCICRVDAQKTDTLTQPEIFYSSPKTYEIGGVEVSGIGVQYDPETLLQLSGLRVGSEIKIPGEAITKAIKRLYAQGLFSDVSISVDRYEGNKVFLNLYLAERHKLSKINFIGLKKSEASKIKEKINPLPGTQVTDNMLANLERIVARYFKDKGFFNIDTKVLVRDDPEHPNFVYIDVTVERKNKIKVKDLVITGNKEIRGSKLKAAMKKLSLIHI